MAAPRPIRLSSAIRFLRWLGVAFALLSVAAIVLLLLVGGGE
jgi:hypothetical protein